MTFAELNAAAIAAYEEGNANYRAFLKTDRSGDYVRPAMPKVEVAGVVVGCNVTSGAANGRSRNAYRFNYNLNGKRSTAAAVAAAMEA